jgi:hypothetical protein
MPEQEGYLGVIRLLEMALARMPDGEAKLLVTKALLETARQARQGVSSLEIGMDLGRLLSKPE